MKNTHLISFSAILFFATGCMTVEISDIETPTVETFVVGISDAEISTVEVPTAETSVTETPEIEVFRETATTLRKMWQEDHYFAHRDFRLPNLSQGKIAESIDTLKSLPKIGDNGAVAFLLSQYKALSSHNAKELFLIFQEAAETSNIHMYPVWLHRNFGETGFSHLRDGFHYIVFPRSAEFEFAISVDVNWGRGGGPNPRSRTEFDFVEPLALIFSRLGLYDLAWRVQLEEGRKRYDNSTVYGRTFHSYYIRAADNAYRAGKKELAWSFLMNAAVFEDERSFEPAMKTAQLWLDIEAGVAELPEAEIAQGEDRKKLFLEIVQRYQNMTAHPRAWLFIEEHKHEFDDPEELIEIVQGNWLAVVRMVTHPRLVPIRVTMYGVQLFPDVGNDPLSIELPWAFSEGSLEKLKASLGALAERVVEEETSGFRMWIHDTSWVGVEGTREIIRAKFISMVGDYVDGVITLEKEDGSTITTTPRNLRYEIQNIHRIRERMTYEALGAGFRTWHYYTGDINILTWIDPFYPDGEQERTRHQEEMAFCIARFVSFVDDIVTLQLDDGSEMTLEFSQLRGDFLSQDYIRRRMEMAALEAEIENIRHH